MLKTFGALVFLPEWTCRVPGAGVGDVELADGRAALVHPGERQRERAGLGNKNQLGEKGFNLNENT